MKDNNQILDEVQASADQNGYSGAMHPIAEYYRDKGSSCGNSSVHPDNVPLDHTDDSSMYLHPEILDRAAMYPRTMRVPTAVDKPQGSVRLVDRLQKS